MSDTQKTEQPTQRRLDKARKQGNFAQSRDFVAAAHWAAFALLAASYGEEWLTGLAAYIRSEIASSFEPRGAGWLLPAAPHAAGRLLLAAALPAAVLVCVIAAAQLAVSGLGISLQKAAPDLKRLNPLTRLRQLPGQGMSQLVQSAVLIPAVLWAVGATLSSEMAGILMLPLRPLAAGLGTAIETAQGVMIQATMAVVVWGLVDLFRQRRKWQAQLRMSKQEIRDEAKESDGNPQVKSRLRRLQRSLLRRKMMSDVSKATAVVVNPTHYAVALR